MANDMVMPLFVHDSDTSVPVPSMPGQQRFSIQKLVTECAELHELGIKGVALFPSLEPSLKDDTGTQALNPDTLVLRAVKQIKARVPNLCIFTDIALDPYTTHGHDGVFNADGTDIANDATVDILSKMAVLHAQTGVDVVSPSDMMDGRIGAIRTSLDDNKFQDTAILSYTAKYNSAYYGPFRDAVGSAKAAGTRTLGKETYQMNPANRKEAMTEMMLDHEEGADILMVKPAGAYLDIISDLSEHSDIPIAAYQVSGEYSQIHAASQLGWLDLEKTRDESLLAIKRAGASIIFSYFAKELAPKLPA